MEIIVLGPPSVRRDGQVFELGPRLERLLTALAVADGAVISVDRLVDFIWMGDPPAGAESSLKTYVTRLRRALRSGRDDVIVFRQPGYQMALEAGELDAASFEREVDEAKRLLRLAETEEALALLDQAMARWTGAAYSGLADEEWVRPEAVRLEGRRIEARQVFIEALLASGATDRAIAESQGLVEEEPLSERPRELLMRALHEAGRSAEALRVLPEYRTTLQEEVGLDPSPTLAELESRIAQRDPTLAAMPRSLKGYELGNRLGEGAFAVVHQAVQLAVGREVAVKIIRAELADRPEFIRQFEHEARTVARVEHPNVVPLYDFWREPGAAYLVMRLLRGGSVADALRNRGRYSGEDVLRLLADVGPALEAAHRVGVVHRDVRPANLLLDTDGTAYLADFGIALLASTIDRADIHSPAYAAPEVLRGETVEPTADVLSLAVTLFELLTGHVPFVDSRDRAALIRRQLNEPLPPVRDVRTDVSAEIDQVLARATAKAPGDRYATVAAFVADVEKALIDHRAPGQPSLTAAVSEHPNPYLGLHAFDEADADRYFGRDALVSDTLAALAAHPLVALVGPSGSGKSSVVRAGAVPALRRGAVAHSDEWFITTMAPGPDPFESLEAALLRVAVNPPVSLRDQLAEPRGLVRAIKRALPDDATLLVVIDQFEELFTQTADSNEAVRFLRELALALEDGAGRIRVLATLRADHFDRPLQVREIADLLQQGVVTVGPLSPDELEQAIVRPAHASGVAVEPALVAELIADVSGRPTALPLLQFALTELYERRVSGLMLASVHHSLGRLTGAVAARADRILDEGRPGDWDVAREVFARLVTHGVSGRPTRRRALRSEFGDGQSTRRLLDAFVDARLLALDRDPATREATVEVAHEALLHDWPALVDWLETDRDDLLAAQRVTEGSSAWVRSGRDDGELARSGRLQSAVDLLERRPELLNEEETAWVEASQETADAEIRRSVETAQLERRQNRRLRRLLGATGALLVLALLASALALVQRSRALASADDADIERLIALSAAQNVEQPDLAILLALEANRRRDDLSTQTAVHRAIVSEPRLVSIFPDPVGEANWTDLSADGRIGVTASFTTGRVAWFDARTGVAFDYVHEFGEPLTKLLISSDGEVTAVGLRGGQVVFIDRSGRPVIAPIDTGSDFGAIAVDRPIDRLFFDFDGPRLVDVATGEELLAYDPGSDYSAGVLAIAEDGLVGVVQVAVERPGQINTEVDIIDLTTGERRMRISDDLGQISASKLSPEGRLALGYEGGMVTIHELTGDGQPVLFQAHDDRVTAISFASDGGLVTVGADRALNTWSDDGAPGPGFDLFEEAIDVAAHDNGWLTVALLDGGHMVLDPEGSLLVIDEHPVDTIASVSPVTPFYDSPSPDFQSVRLVDLDTGDLVREIDLASVHPDGIDRPFYSTSGSWILTIGQPSGRLAVTEINGDRQYILESTRLFEEIFGSREGGSRTAARPSDDGQRIFVIGTGNFDGARAVWIDVIRGEVVAGPIDVEFGGPSLVLADGRVVIGSDGPLAILPADLASDPIILPDSTGLTPFHQDPATGRVLLGGLEGKVGILDPDAASVTSIEGVGGVVVGGAFAPSGDRLAVTTTTGEVQLLDIAERELLGVAMDAGPRGLVDTQQLRWSADGAGVWAAVGGGPVLLSADPTKWRAIACDVVDRELSDPEWQAFVSADGDPTSACV